MSMNPGDRCVAGVPLFDVHTNEDRLGDRSLREKTGDEAQRRAAWKEDQREVTRRKWLIMRFPFHGVLHSISNNILHDPDP